MLDSVIDSKSFNNFEIIEAIKQQLFIKAPCLNQEPELTRIFEMLLCKREAISFAKASPSADSITIQFDSKKLPLEKLFILLDTILANIKCKASNSICTKKTKAVNPAETESTSNFFIHGMKCESCALSLEMVISRYPKVDKAFVDFKSSILKVYGDVSHQEIVSLIRVTGFDPITQ